MLLLRCGEYDGPILVAQRDILRHPRLVQGSRRLSEQRRRCAKSGAPADGPAIQTHRLTLQLVQYPFVHLFTICGGARDSYARRAARVVVCDAREVQQASWICWSLFWVRFFERHGRHFIFPSLDIRPTVCPILSSPHQTAHVHVEVRVGKEE